MLSFLKNRNTTFYVGSVIISIAFFLAVFGPYITPYKPNQSNTDLILSPPSLAHPFGTDPLGRDILSRVLAGARIDFGAVLVVVGGGMAIGTILGLIAGFFGGWINEVIMRMTDVFMTIPYLVLAMAVAAALGPGLISMILAMITAWWRGYARMVRGETISVKEENYIEASRAIGNGNVRILFRHILPNVVPPIVVYATLDMGSAILTVATLSFLGYGVQPPTPEWGAMISSARDYITSAWWYISFPGLAIAFVVGGFNLLGDSLRDILDPTLRNQ